MVSEQDYVSGLNGMLMEMMEAVETMGDQVHDALVNHKKGMRQQIYDQSKSIQIKEEEVEETGIQCMIRYQPLASDLRAVTVAMKISYDLGRVARYIYNVLEMNEEFNLRECDIHQVIELFGDSREMVRQSIRAYLNKDAKMATEICSNDDSIDNRYRDILDQYKHQGVFSGECILFNGLTARIVERMADHACYISHEVIYLVTGRRQFYR